MLTSNDKFCRWQRQALSNPPTDTSYTLLIRITNSWKVRCSTTMQKFIFPTDLNFKHNDMHILSENIFKCYWTLDMFLAKFSCSKLSAKCLCAPMRSINDVSKGKSTSLTNKKNSRQWVNFSQKGFMSLAQELISQNFFGVKTDCLSNGIFFYCTNTLFRQLSISSIYKMQFQWSDKAKMGEDGS